MQWKTASHWPLGGHTDSTSLASWRTDSISAASPHPGWGCTAMKLSGMRWHPGGQGRSSPVCHLPIDWPVYQCLPTYLPSCGLPTVCFYLLFSLFLPTMYQVFSLSGISVPPIPLCVCLPVCLPIIQLSIHLFFCLFFAYLPVPFFPVSISVSLADSHTI